MRGPGRGGSCLPNKYDTVPVYKDVAVLVLGEWTLALARKGLKMNS